MNIRKATLNDLPYLKELEQLTFPEFQQSSFAALKRSVNSLNQEVFLLEFETGAPLASMILYVFKKSIRL
ncbi:MAG: hypothetical protein WD530_05345, partial [Vicingaceae bacterium]